VNLHSKHVICYYYLEQSKGELSGPIGADGQSGSAPYESEEQTPFFLRKRT